MKKISTFRRVLFAIVMMLTATFFMNAQDLPWHVVVYDDNGKEVANHSVEIIDTVTLSAQNVNFLLTTGTTYSYPRTSMFSFDQRAGNGTAIATIAAPQWNVYYSGNYLHFTEQVNGIAVYTVYGTLVTRSSGRNTDFPVSLMQGIYVIQAGGKSTKLLVTSNSSGTSSIQSDMAPVRPQTSYAPSTTSPPDLRASTATALKEWWNVNAGNTITPIEIAKVDDFYIASNNAIIFFMKDGNTVQLDDYQGTSVSTQPTASQNIDWDVAKTILYGGATYAWGFSPPTITFAAIHKNGIAFHSQEMDNSFSEDQRFANSIISSKLWDAGNNPNSRLSMFYYSLGNNYGMSYPAIDPEIPDIPVVFLITTGGETHETGSKAAWSYNNGTNLIPTTFTKGTNSLTMTCTDYTGKTWSYTFSAW